MKIIAIEDEEVLVLYSLHNMPREGPSKRDHSQQVYYSAKDENHLSSVFSSERPPLPRINISSQQIVSRRTLQSERGELFGCLRKTSLSCCSSEEEEVFPPKLTQKNLLERRGLSDGGSWTAKRAPPVPSDEDPKKTSEDPQQHQARRSDDQQRPPVVQYLASVKSLKMAVSRQLKIPLTLLLITKVNNSDEPTSPGPAGDGGEEDEPPPVGGERLLEEHEHIDVSAFVETNRGLGGGAGPISIFDNPLLTTTSAGVGDEEGSPEREGSARSRTESLNSDSLLPDTYFRYLVRTATFHLKNLEKVIPKSVGNNPGINVPRAAGVSSTGGDVRPPTQPAGGQASSSRAGASGINNGAAAEDQSSSNEMLWEELNSQGLARCREYVYQEEHKKHADGRKATFFYDRCCLQQVNLAIALAESQHMTADLLMHSEWEVVAPAASTEQVGRRTKWQQIPEEKFIRARLV